MLRRTSTTATISHTYRPQHIPSKKVDFVLALDPRADVHQTTTVKEAINRILRESGPAPTVNHTSCDALIYYPIAITIETKRQDSGKGSQAQLQIGVFSQAQWAHLEKLGADKGALARLGFLPGLVVNGDTWELVATTYSPDGIVSADPGLPADFPESQDTDRGFYLDFAIWLPDRQDPGRPGSAEGHGGDTATCDVGS
jgi:hypothetical protein